MKIVDVVQQLAVNSRVVGHCLLVYQRNRCAALHLSLLRYLPL